MTMETSLQRTELHYSHHVRFPTIKYLPGRLPAEGARYVIFLLRWSPIKMRLCKFQSIVALKEVGFSGLYLSKLISVTQMKPATLLTETRKKKSEREFHSSFPNPIVALDMKPIKCFSFLPLHECS